MTTNGYGVADWVPSWLAELLYWVHHEQALIAGASALAVGYWTVRSLRRQRSEEAQRFRETRHRKLRSVRAGLPIALTQIHDYAEASIDLLTRLYKAGTKESPDTFDMDAAGEVLPTLVPFPAYPAQAFQTLQAVIEHADEHDAEQLHIIICFGQIQYSRLQSLVREIDPDSNSGMVLIRQNIFALIRDAVALRLHVDRVYRYARGAAEQIDELANASTAADTLMWLAKGNEDFRQYILEHWPPDFPKPEPASPDL